jgi:hypothetical protein
MRLWFWAALAAVATSGTVRAADKADDKDWAYQITSRKVTPADIAATYPKAAFDRKISGGATLDCTADEAGLEVDCHVLDEDPPGMGFGQAAMQLVAKERVKTKDAKGVSIVGRRFRTNFFYLAPGDANPEWVKKPTASDLAGVFPKFKNGRGVDGRAVINCKIDETGFLQRCVVASEEPAGLGFGAAALQLAPQFRMTPKIRAGKPVPGGEMNIPIIWKGFGDYHPVQAELNSLVLDPPWTKTPSLAQVRAAWPANAKEAKSGQVALRCVFTRAGGLGDCQTISELPAGRGFGKAARSLIPFFSVRFAPDQIREMNKISVDVPFRFRDPAEPDNRKITTPTWVRHLTAEGMAAVYPETALKAGIKSGLGVIGCVIGGQGQLSECEVRREEPAGQDFGAAAMEASKSMSINPWSKEGEPQEGLQMILPIRFNWQEAADAVTEAPATP